MTLDEKIFQGTGLKKWSSSVLINQSYCSMKGELRRCFNAGMSPTMFL